MNIETKHGYDLFDLNPTKVFGEDIGRIVDTRDEKDFNFALLNDVADVVVANVYVFGPFFGNGVLGDE